MQFSRDGVTLDYPDGWDLTEEGHDAGWTAEFAGPSTLSLTLHLQTDVDDPQGLAAAAVAALRGEYEDLEAEWAVESVGGRPLVGYDVDFMALDLTNTCRVRAAAVDNGCVLLIAQATDADWDEAMMDGLIGSLRTAE